jgi:hypothetical protein
MKAKIKVYLDWGWTSEYMEANVRISKIALFDYELLLLNKYGHKTWRPVYDSEIEFQNNEDKEKLNREKIIQEIIE